MVQSNFESCWFYSEGKIFPGAQFARAGIAQSYPSVLQSLLFQWSQYFLRVFSPCLPFAYIIVKRY